MAVVLAVLAAKTASRRDEGARPPRETTSSASPPETVTAHASSSLSASPSASARTPSAPLDVDLDAIVDQVHFAYRLASDGARYEGAHTTYAVAVDASSVLFTPYARGRAGAPLSLTVEAISRGGSASSPIRGAITVASDGHLVVHRGGIEEHYRNREEGVEESWSFARAPSGEGDLVVAVRPEGQALVEATSSGLHFADARTGVGARYGHGTWIDASGRATHVDARYVRGRIELVVPSRLLETSAYPAVLDPVIAPEQGTDAPAVGPVDGTSSEPQIATNGDGFLVVWRTRSDIFAARLAADGTLLDAPALAVSNGANGWGPKVASNGTDYLVVWLRDGRALAARVPGEGGPPGAPFFVSSEAADFLSDVEVASNGSEYMVVWGDSQRTEAPGGGIYGARVSSDGTLIAPNDIAIHVPSSDVPAALVAFGDGYYLGSTDGERVSFRGTFMSSTGVLAVPEGTSISPRSRARSLASNGSLLLAIWSDDDTIYGARVDADGTVLDTNGFLIAPRSRSIERLGVAAIGTTFVAAWAVVSSMSPSVRFARVSPAGAVLDPGGIELTVPENGRHVAVVPDDTGVRVVWDDRRIWSAHVDTGGTAGPREIVSYGVSSQIAPSVASTGSSYLLAWSDNRIPGIGGDIFGVRLGLDGAVLDVSGLHVSDAVGAQRAPVTVAMGPEYFVAWRDERNGNPDVYGARISGDGALRDPEGIAIVTEASAQIEPTIASDGTNALVAWTDHRAGGASSDVYGTLVTNAGDVLTPSGAPLRATPSAEIAPSVASRGEDFLLAWVDATEGIGTVRVSATGSPVAGTVQSLTSASRQPGEPAVASNGQDYVVAWTQRRQTGFGTEIAVRRVSSEGLASAPALRFQDLAAQRAPAVTALGASYFVVWNNEIDLFGSRLVGETFEDAFGVTLANESTSEHSAALASGSVGQVLVAFVRAADTGIEAQRVRSRLVTFATERGGACTRDDDCDRGSCVDGVCCDTACGLGAIDCLACSVAAGGAVDGTCGVVVVPGTACRPSVGLCDPAETCDGVTAACPVNVMLPEGTPCDDARSCTDASECSVGVCQATVTFDCSDADPCTADACAEPRACTHTPIANCMVLPDGGVVIGGDAGADVDGGVGAPQGDGGGCGVARRAADEPSALVAFVFAWALAAASRRTARRHT